MPSILRALYSLCSEKRALLETRKAKNDLQRIESLSMEQSKLENEIKVLEELKIVAESDIDDMTKVLDTTFSPSIFEQTEKDYAQENSYIDSIQLSIGHIRHEYNKYITKWGSQKGPHNDLLDTMEDGMKRICSIEVNRCIGKYGEPLPVYKKRAELNRLISANDVVIVTAQTGSGKVSYSSFSSGLFHFSSINCTLMVLSSRLKFHSI